MVQGGKSRAQTLVGMLDGVKNYSGPNAVWLGAQHRFQNRVSIALAALAEDASNGLPAARAAMELAERAAKAAEFVGAGRYSDPASTVLTPALKGKVADGMVEATPVTYQESDRWGNVISVSDARNRNWKTEYSYNAANQLVSTTMAEAEDRNTGIKVRAVARNAYDKLGRLYAATDAKGNVNITGYDANSNAIVEIHADGGVVRKSYDVFGNRIALEQERGAGLGIISSEYGYDRLGQLTSSTSAAVDVYWTNIQSGGGMMANRDGKKKLTEKYGYDELGRRISVTNAMEQTTYTGYDLAGNLAMQEDATGRKTWSTYDAFHHKTEQSDVNGSMFWTVDAYGKITSHTDLGGGKTTYEHNELNQVTKQSIGTVSRSNVQGIDVREATVTIRGQERSYEYRDGVLVKVTDREEASGKVLSTTSYSYNLAGKRSRERTVDKDGVVVQDNFIEYDTLGRMKEVADNHFNVKFYYDLNGNRTLVKSHYVVGNDQENTVDAYNEFDAMNRETIANGEWDSASNMVVRGKNGHQIAYDQIGLRLSDSYQYKPTGKDYSNSTVEKYEYDAAGRLTMVRRDGYLTDERQYDAAGRVVRSGAGIGEDGNKLRDFGVVAETRTYAYDAAGRATRVKYRNNDYYGKDNGSKNTNFKDDIYYASVNERGGGYDLAGNLSAYSIVPPKYAEHTVVRNNYIRFDGYKSLTVEAEREQHKATTTYEYDAFGNVVKVSDSGKEALTRTFTNDTDGRVLRKQQDGVLTRSLIVNGELLGESNNQLNPDGLANPYEPANSGANTAAPSIYYAQEGDNLQSIAKALWGDSKLWYLIADANSRSTPDVNAGEMLIIPTRANTLHNDHSTFKPYNQAEQIGDTMPTLPAPAGPKAACGGAGQLIMVVVAVAVTYFTGGLLGGVAGQMLGAALGSVASQAVGMALGIQDSFSWKGVALAAVSAGVTQGVGSMVEGSWLAGAGWQAAAGRAVISNVISQGIGNITHLQNGFSWRSVAAAGVGGAISSGVDDAIGLTDKGVAVGGLKFGERLFKETISGLASGTASAIARGGKISVTQIATDAFGNALGKSLTRTNWGDSNDVKKTSPGVIQTNSSTDLRSMNLRLPTGTRFLVQPEEASPVIPYAGEVVVPGKKLTFWEEAWSYVEDAGSAIADFVGQLGSATTQYGVAQSPAYFTYTLPRSDARGASTPVRMPVQTPPSLWHHGVNGLASSLTTMVLGGDGPTTVLPAERQAWAAANPNRSIFGGRPTVQYDVDVFNMTASRSVVTGESFGDKMKNILSLGVRPVGLGVGNFAGALQTANDESLPWSVRSQAAYDAGANSPAVVSALAMAGSPLVKFNRGANKIDLQKLRSQYGVNEANLQVEATFEHNGSVFYDVNQTARNPVLATDAKLPIYSESKALAGAPNQTFATAHAEVGAMGQSFAKGNLGGDAVLNIFGKDACSFCVSDVKRMGLQLQLDSLTVIQPSGTVKFVGPMDFAPTKKGGLKW